MHFVPARYAARLAVDRYLSLSTASVKRKKMPAGGRIPLRSNSNDTGASQRHAIERFERLEQFERFEPF
jgi:hypothetical protein